MLLRFLICSQYFLWIKYTDKNQVDKNTCMSYLFSLHRLYFPDYPMVTLKIIRRQILKCFNYQHKIFNYVIILSGFILRFPHKITCWYNEIPVFSILQWQQNEKHHWVFTCFCTMQNTCLWRDLDKNKPIIYFIKIFHKIHCWVFIYLPQTHILLNTVLPLDF